MHEKAIQVASLFGSAGVLIGTQRLMKQGGLSFAAIH
jgi:hypothetical protein